MEGKKIVVLGGGTAGWMTALWCRQTFASSSITVIENTSLGTVGVGEGTTPQFVRFLHFVGLDEFDVMRESGGSVKSGISFENWNGDNKKYFHSFRGEDVFSMPPHFDGGCEKYYYQTLLKEGLDFNEYAYAAKISYQNKIDLYHMPTAIHFDASKLGTYLRKIGEQRNIVCVDGNFSHVQVDEDGFIKTLCLDNDVKFECDFVFDCSGFAKLLIGKYYKVGWNSYKDFLPMDKAIAFKLDSETDIKPYTQSIAMNSGWLWKIPLQGRIGAGYVFDSDYVTDEEAIHEVQQTLNQTIANVRSIPFDTGRHEQFWVKNCIAIGLASNFVEPLEATALDSVSQQLIILADFLNHMFNYNEKSISLYNATISNKLEVMTHFIYLHYLTKRSDTEFWKNFKHRYPPPQQFEKLLQLIYANNLRDRDLQIVGMTSLSAGQYLYFGLIDFYEICNGLELFKQPINMDGYENLTPSVAEYKTMTDAGIDSAMVMRHTDFLVGLHGPDRVGSPYGPPCIGVDCNPWFHRTEK